jgi:hypothetical protein
VTDQLSMFRTGAYGDTAISPDFDGETYEPARDKARLTGQLGRVRALMSDGEWRTLRQIAEAVTGSEAGVSARLRDLRKVKFGAHGVERRRVDGGLFEYRLVSG